MTARIIAAIVLAVVGGVFVGQGLGYIGGSFMTSDIRWSVVGAVLLVVAVALVATGRRRS